MSRSPWRIGAVWAVLAGALLGGGSLASGAALLRLVGAVWLADSAWGAVWSLFTTLPTAQQPVGRLVPLPYVQPASPLHALTRGIAEAVAGEGWRELAASLALVLGLACLLGRWALLFSVLALALVACSHLVVRAGRQPCLCHALLAVALPWSLGASLADGLPRSQLLPIAVLAGAFVLLEWGIQRLRGGDTLVIWAGQGAVILALVGLRFSGAAAVVGAMLLLPSLWLLRLRSGGTTGQAVAERGAIWWWAALVTCVLAVRLTWL